MKKERLLELAGVQLNEERTTLQYTEGLKEILKKMDKLAYGTARSTKDVMKDIMKRLK